MSALAEPLHEAIEAALRASTALEAATATPFPLFTVVPTNQSPPYIVIGDDQLLGDDTDCADGAEAFVTVNVWTKPNPPQGQSCRTICDLIRDILNAPLDVDGHEVVDWQVESLNFITDTDGSTHGICRFRYLISELVA
jgi:hypothetical protein